MITLVHFLQFRFYHEFSFLNLSQITYFDLLISYSFIQLSVQPENKKSYYSLYLIINYNFLQMLKKCFVYQKLEYEHHKQTFWLHNNLCEFTALEHKSKRIQQKGMTFDHDFFNSFAFSTLSFFGGKRKEEKNSQSRSQKSCISARSFKRRICTQKLVLNVRLTDFWYSKKIRLRFN